MKKGLMLLSLLVAAVTSASNADDTAIKKALNLENGMMIPDYQGPKEMAAILEGESCRN